MRERIIINPDTQCWEWQGALSSAGYPEVQINGKMSYAYRFLYFLWTGDWPVELHHECGNTTCCNPFHLKPFNSHGEHMSYQNLGRANRHHEKCIRGHEFTPENTYVSPKGVRTCKKCRIIRVDIYRKKHRR